jgi:hypothetical protein
MSDMEILSSWFESAGGELDSAMGFSNFTEDGGRGAVALQDLDVRHPFCMIAMMTGLTDTGLPRKDMSFSAFLDT